MTCLTKTELENAERDVSDLSAVINGPQSGGSSTVTTRLGVVIKTLARVIYETSIPTASAIVGLLDTYFGSTSWRDSPLTTKGDLFGFSTLSTRIPVGSNNQVLTADSSQTLGVKWATGITGAASSNVLKAGDTMSGVLAHAVGTIAVQAVQRSLQWSTGNVRWKEVLEADGSYALYNYDVNGANSFRSLLLPPNGSSNPSVWNNPAQFQSNVTVLGNATVGFQNAVSGGVYVTPTSTYGKPAVQAVTSAFGAERLYLNPIGGGVTINTTHATNNAAYVGASATSAATSSSYTIGYGDESGNIQAAFGYDASYAFIQSWQGKPLLINSQGNNVGIGNVNPTAKLHVNGTIRCASYTVATLPNAATVGDGSRAQVTDANATTFHNAVSAGGANNVSVIVCGGTWRIGG